MTTDLGIDQAQETASGTLIDRARAAVPTLAAPAARTDRDRRVAPESLAAARQAGAFRMRTPTDRGGYDTDLQTTVAILTELGRGCPSTAWLAGVSTEAKSMFVPLMTTVGQNDLLADPDAVLCGSGAPPGHADVVNGGLRVSGRWSTPPGARTRRGPGSWSRSPTRGGPSAPPWRPCRSTSWTSRHVGQYRAPGHRQAHAHRTRNLRTAEPRRAARPGWCRPRRTPLSPAVGHRHPAGADAGRRSAHEVVTSVLETRRPPGTSLPSLTASAGARQWFGEATRLLDSADRRVQHVAAKIDRLAPGDNPTLTHRAGMKMELVTAAREAREAVDRLLDLHGSSSFAVSNPLQRFWRDLNVGIRHARLTPYLAAQDHDHALVGHGD